MTQPCKNEPPRLEFTAYFDESKGPEGVFAIAGYVRREDYWASTFSPLWSDVLARQRVYLSEFSASDCRNGVELFKGMTPEERRQLTEDLVSVIVSPQPPLLGVGAAVVTRDFEDPQVQRKYDGVSYLVCLSTVVEHVMRLCGTHRSDVYLRFVFDERSDLVGVARETFQEVIEEHRGRFAGTVRPLEFRSSREFPPLQAADLLAYETYKEAYNRFYSPQPRKVSIALDRLVSEGLVFGTCLTRFGFMAIVAGLLAESEGDQLARRAWNWLADGHFGALYCSETSEPIRPSSGRALLWWKRQVALMLLRVSRRRRRAVSR